MSNESVVNMVDSLTGGDNVAAQDAFKSALTDNCLLYTSPSPRDGLLYRMPSSA